MFIENNQNHPLTPGERSRSAHLSLPPPGDQTNMILQGPAFHRPNEEMIRRSFREKEMAIGPFIPGESSRSAHLSPPLPGDQTNILWNPAFRRPHEEMNQRFHREEIRVREELGKRSHYNLPPPRLPPDQTNKAQYCLVFLNKVKDRIYANDLVRAEKGDPIKVAIFDTFTQSIISTDHFLSSAIVMLAVLDAEFCENKWEAWSWNEFNQSVLSGRNGKGPILVGPRLTIQLKNGVGTFENIIFNDNSSWSKDRFIRLGVMVKGEGEKGYLNGKRVQEGVSKPFRVLDRRSKASEKPKWLKLTNKVQYIVKIGTRRADVLKNYNIKTVEDFLWWYYNHESALRQILNIKRESAKEWLSMVDHVMQCADEFRAKYNALNNSSHPQQDVESNKIHANIESGNILNGNSLQHTNVSGTPQIDPLTYLTFDGLDANTPFPMEGFGVSGSGGDGDSDFVSPFTGGNDGGGARF